ncbi:LytTR family DNA-binding domain-containing protein [Phenylobacterium sp.]|uniref:LytTR family DNA-binding domain-containing protein n=1 Tax=Phenylobacterium sp. TaxID=1871053 RepID=UPI0025EC20D5|nr:LytTR family DNA-binding domain-containing protein [Phenylobacterium sp.]
MRPTVTAATLDLRHAARRGAQDLGLGFLYWLGFVLVLEPDNLMRWTPPDAAAWLHEALRLFGASLLGAAATPAILALTRRAPIEAPFVWRRGLLHLAFNLAMTFALIVASCLLARVLPHSAHRPLMRDIAEQLGANGALVAAWIAGLTALAHAARNHHRRNFAVDGAAAGLAVRQRGHFTRLDLSQVAWIETQGNYLALHGAAGATLLRRTAKSLEPELDPSRFIRIHRRAIVALDAVKVVTPLPAGDALLRLKTGETLRVSRSCRARLHQALESVG